MATEVAAAAPAVDWSKRRFAWGAALLLGAAVLSAGTAVLHDWTYTPPWDRLEILGMSQWHLMALGVFLYGAAAMVGFIMLAGPVLSRMRPSWIRWTATVFTALVVLGAILAGVSFELFSLQAAGGTAKATVMSDEGVRVVVAQSGLDRGLYDIYIQKSEFVYQWAAYTTTRGRELDLKKCSVADGAFALVLTCEANVVMVPAMP